MMTSLHSPVVFKGASVNYKLQNTLNRQMLRPNVPTYTTPLKYVLFW